jgi:hypothetical protein
VTVRARRAGYQEAVVTTDGSAPVALVLVRAPEPAVSPEQAQ